MRARGSLTQCPSGSPRSPASHPALRRALGNNSWDVPVSAGNQSSSCPPWTSGLKPGRGAHSLPLLGPQTFWSPCGPSVHTNRPAPNFLSWGTSPGEERLKGFYEKASTRWAVPCPFLPPSARLRGGTFPPRGSRARRHRAARRQGFPRPAALSRRRLAAGFRPRRTPRPPACMGSQGAEEWSLGSFPAFARTQRPTGALTMFLLPKAPLGALSLLGRG